MRVLGFEFGTKIFFESSLAEAQFTIRLIQSCVKRRCIPERKTLKFLQMMVERSPTRDKAEYVSVTGFFQKARFMASILSIIAFCLVEGGEHSHPEPFQFLLLLILFCEWFLLFM